MVLDDDGLVAHSGNIRSSGGAGAHNNGNLRNTQGTHASLVKEDAAKVFLVWKDVCLVREIRAARIDEVEAGEFVLLSNCLCAEMLLDRDWVIGTSFDSAIISHNHTGDPFDCSDPCDDTPCGDVVGVDFVACEGREFQERGAWVDEGGDSIAGKHLSSGEVFVLCFLRATLGDSAVEIGHSIEELLHLLGVVLEV